MWPLTRHITGHFSETNLPRQSITRVLTTQNSTMKKLKITRRKKHKLTASGIGWKYFCITLKCGREFAVCSNWVMTLLLCHPTLVKGLILLFVSFYLNSNLTDCRTVLSQPQRSGSRSGINKYSLRPFVHPLFEFHRDEKSQNLAKFSTSVHL